MTVTEEELRAWEAAEQQATPGPWSEPYWCDDEGDRGWWIHNGKEGMEEFAIAVTFSLNKNGEADANLIALARTALPELIVAYREQSRALYEQDESLREEMLRADTAEAKWAAAQAEIVKLLNAHDAIELGNVELLAELRKVVE